MIDPASQRDAELGDLLQQARTELRQCGTLDLPSWQSRCPEHIEELMGLLETAHDLDTLLGGQTAPATAGYLKGSRSGAEASSSQLPSAPLPEQIGRYRILERVGGGGMGTVYRAHDPQLDRVVALKVPRLEEVGQDRDVTLQRFLREARAAAGVRHAHVCPIHDAGEHAGTPYVVMAFIEGSSLAKLAKQGRLESTQAVQLVCKVATGLEAIHAQGIIHRDLKPGNILLDPAGEPLVTDFGLARSGQDSECLTVHGSMLGTPAYMAPEQVSPDIGPIGPWTDIYSLGVVLFQLLVGRTPFTGSPLTLPYQVAHETPPAPSKFRSDLDPGLEAIVVRALARQPADRYRSAREFGEALQSWLKGEQPVLEGPPLPAAASAGILAPTSVRTDLPGGGAVTVTVDGGSRTPSDITVTLQEQKATARKRRKLRIKITVAFALFLAAGGILTSQIVRHESGEPSDLQVAQQESKRAQEEELRSKKEAASKEREAELKANRAQLVQALDQLDRVLRQRGSQDQAEPLLREAVAMWQKLYEAGSLPDVHPQLATSLANVGSLLYDRGELAQADPSLRKALAMRRRLYPVKRFPNGHPELVQTLNSLGRVLRERGNLSQAEPLFREAVAMSQKLYPARGFPQGHADLATSLDNLGLVLHAQGKPAEAQPLFEKSLAMRRSILGEQHPQTAALYNHLADSLQAQHKDDQAKSLYESAIATYSSLLAKALELGSRGSIAREDFLSQLATSYNNLGSLHQAKGGFGQAKAFFEKALTVQEQLLAGSPQRSEIRRELAVTWNNLGTVLRALGHSGEAAVYFQRALKVWDDFGEHQMFALHGPDADVRRMAFSPDGTLLATGTKARTVLWDTASGQRQRTLQGPTSPVTCLAFSPDSKKLVTASEDGAVSLWRVPTGEQLLSLKGYQQPVTSVAFSPDGKQLACASQDKLVKLWDAATGKAVLSRPAETTRIYEIAFSPEGKCLASGQGDGTTVLWEVASGERILALKDESGPVVSVAFCPTDKLLARVSDHGVEFWNTATGKEIQLLKGKQAQVASVAFSADGKLLASVSRGGVKVWNVATGKEVLSLGADAGKILSIAISANGRRLASASEDGTVRVWNLVRHPKAQP
jgi:tetratricopeptide (TPR) repeat protein